MGALLEHKDLGFSDGEGTKIDPETLTDEPLILLDPHGGLMFTNKVRIIEVNTWDLVPEEADDLDDLDRIENELRILITWLHTMPEGEDRDVLLEDLEFELGEVPWAREMLTLEAEADATHEAVEV